MKRIVTWALLAAMILGLSACGGEQGKETKPAQTVERVPDYVVGKPMARPDYSYEDGYTPTTDELRARAVQAMNDMLSIQWCTENFVTYRKEGAVANKTFLHAPGNTFCGLPYADHNGSIFTFMEYYDHETGILNVPGDGQNFNASVGNTCTGSIMWAWSTVCDSLDGMYSNFYMVEKWGCYPLGDYTYNKNINSYRDYSTQQICLDNGKDKIIAGYALCLPADGLSSSPQDHGMMVIEPAHVEYLPDGSIDCDKSYLVIQDQRAGTGSLFYEVEEDGEIHHYSGRTSHTYTFNQLYDMWYIPVTTAEFRGTEPYAQPEVTITKQPADFTELLRQTISCNYPMCVLRFLVVEEDGTENLVYRQTFGRDDVYKGHARNFSMSTAGPLLKPAVENCGLTGTFRVEAVVSNGEEFVVTEFPFNG